MYKWIGGILIIAGCGGFGYSLARAHRREETMLRQLIGALDFMECELHYRLTPLPDLCHQTSRDSKGPVSLFFRKLAEELDAQINPDVYCCVKKILKEFPCVPRSVAEGFEVLGKSLGRFDLAGQIKGLESVRGECRRKLDSLAVNRESRLRTYQTLGICAGAAIAILFI